MAFINQNLGDAREAEAVPEGRYELRVVKVTERESAKGNKMYQCMLRIEDSDVKNPAPFNHFIMIAGDQTPVETGELFALNNARFFQTFNIPYEDDGFDDEDLMGASGTCDVQQELDDNNIPRNSLRLPRLNSE